MAVARFEELAESFVAFVDDASHLPADRFVGELERHLLDLYRAALDLALPEDAEDAAPPSAVTNDEAAALQRRLSDQLGDFDVYRLVFDPYELDAPPVAGSLADDVADIYRDLKSGLAATNDAEATWQWRFGFDTHWGRHAAHALYALYNLRGDKLG